MKTNYDELIKQFRTAEVTKFKDYLTKNIDKFSRNKIAAVLTKGYILNQKNNELRINKYFGPFTKIPLVTVKYDGHFDIHKGPKAIMNNDDIDLLKTVRELSTQYKRSDEIRHLFNI